ncbi:RNI-like protein [Myriangium duriaei CBS 260.36]|uniref:RNI-like protein n=1 Tax=Myriangium duriaei CBS 260.36 TaxID=1168546 RepID=A0A9P4J7F6_9PEZI|nr:RNI-like protein [Myriangium duriaei CBS 260.36]
MALEIRVVPEHEISPSPNSPLSPAYPRSPGQQEEPQKLKGRRRLLGGFHRMSSSPSLARMGRTSSSGYKNGKASVSCISLSSPGTPFGMPLGSSLSTELSSGYTTSPTSAASTPGIQIPVFDDNARIRYLEKLNAAGVAAVPRSVRAVTTPGVVQEQDYFSIQAPKTRRPRPDLNFWRELPAEIRTEILSYLTPREVIRCSAVSKAWHKNCFDGQLWAVLDTCEFYQKIPAEALVSIITSAGPFVRDLNLRGCVQLREKWHRQGLADACKNLEYFSLEGCRIDKTSIHSFLLHNPRLVHINLSGLTGVTNAGMKIIATHCTKLEHLNVSWCNNIDTRGLTRVIESCHNLSDLRAGEVRGWDDLTFMQLLFETNRLQTLVVMSCDSLNDESFKVLMQGKDPEIDYLNGRPIVPPRALKYLDISRCRNVSDRGFDTAIHNLENLEGLQISKCAGISGSSLNSLIPTLTQLTHLDVEELDQLNNVFLQTLAESPCARSLRHLSISYCENLGDTGMLPVLKSCTALQSLEMDNTRISDLVLVEAASMVRRRSTRTTDPRARPSASFRLVAYDCQNVTWTGIREILSRNAEIVTQRRIISNPSPIPSRTTTPVSSAFSLPTKSSRSSAELTTKSTTTLPAPPTVTTETVQLVRTYPTQVIALKCFYNYQPTVHEHTKRVLRGDFGAATRLERKWAEFMVANEEAGATGAGHRRRRRRAREAQMMHADEADEGVAPGNGGGVGGGRRRRARSGGCVVM